MPPERDQSVVRISKISIVALVISALGWPASAGLFEGLRAYYLNDYETAHRELKRVAEQGNPKAQYHVGLMFLFGNGNEGRA